MNRSSGVPRPSQRRFSTSEPSSNGMVFYLFKHDFPSSCRGFHIHRVEGALKTLYGVCRSRVRSWLGINTQQVPKILPAAC
jgi:hypothetical protein